ncbi:undecaprenyl/decaprenyl-phosphate alpha-N-acetylglucosaminyl 1-phosphate transferase [Candidatus Fermentibacterales bacterium]|nr:undecaprenyl/decaprenyl-phosphate alpha-N-acetylglucosaminyl 1-phosphate transferase [Candidatus Fermentibacterales bacterium]
MLESAVAFLIAAAVTIAATPAVRMLATRLDFVDHPGDRKRHHCATPLMGGLGIYLAFSLAVLAGVLFWPGLAQGHHSDTPLQLVPLSVMMIGGGLVMVIVGLLDDRFELRPRTKLVLHTAAALLAGLYFVWRGAQVTLFLNAVPWLAGVVTLLWLVGITNSLNLLDHADGLAAGAGGIASLFFMIINLLNGNEAVAFICAALAGASFGFLVFNFSPASVFMGDAGSNFIGFTLGVIAVLGVYTPQGSIRELAVLSPILILAVPILDTILVAEYRLRRGAPLFAGDRNHLAHRLMRIGFSAREAVGVLYSLGILLGLLALLLPTLHSYQAVLVMANALGVSIIVALFIRNGERKS